MTRAVEPKLFMRSGFAISCLGHMAILTVALIFAGANPFDPAPTEAITVDIVSPNEVEAEVDKVTAAPTGAPETAPSSEPAAPAPPQPTPPSTPQAAPTLDQRATLQTSVSMQALPSPPSFMPWFKPPPDALPPADTHETNPADMFGVLLAPPSGPDYPGAATEKPNISDDAIAAFRKHLKTCSVLRARVAAEAKVTLRIHLDPDGTLAKGLDQNPHAVGTVFGVSVGGGDLFNAAMAAVRKCQPYKMLPPDQYEEWKTLDLTFTRENF